MDIEAVDYDRAYREIYRVLKPGMCLFTVSHDGFYAEKLPIEVRA